MARVYYGLDREYTSDLSKQPTRDTSTTGLDIEFSVDTAAGLTRKDVELGLQRLAAHINQTWVTNATDSDFDL